MRIDINIHMIAAIIVTVALYPIYATVRLWRDCCEAVERIGNAIETWYWCLDRILIVSWQLLTVAIIFLVAMMISPVRVMA